MMTLINAPSPTCLRWKSLLEEERNQFGSQVDKAESLFNELLIGASRVSRMKQGEGQARWLASYLFRDHGYRFRCTHRSEDFSLTRTLLAKSGNCLGLTTLYVVLATSLGVAISPLLFESHIAACFAQNTSSVIELSRGGVLLPEHMARRMHGNLAGRVLSGSELRAVHLSNRAAFVMVPQGREVEALHMFDLALQLFPDYVGGRINRTALLLHMHRWKEASSELDRVLKCDLGPQYRQVANTMLRQLIRGTMESRIGMPISLGVVHENHSRRPSS